MLEHRELSVEALTQSEARELTLALLGRDDAVARAQAHVVARESLTCLVLSCTPIRPYAGRGAGALGAAEPSSAGLPPGTCAVDVTSHVHRKLKALARHRTQYPITPSMLPQSLLQIMLGTEFFRRIGDGSGNAAISRCAKPSYPRRPAGRPSSRHPRRLRDPSRYPPHQLAKEAADVHQP